MVVLVKVNVTAHYCFVVAKFVKAATSSDSMIIVYRQLVQEIQYSMYIRSWNIVCH
jgi:hypothetical protein